MGLWKEGVSLDAVPVEEFRQRHPSIKTGKGSLNFRLTDERLEADLREVIQRAMERAWAVADAGCYSRGEERTGGR